MSDQFLLTNANNLGDSREGPGGGAISQAEMVCRGEKWSIVVYLSRFAQAAIFSMLSCTPSLNTTPSMT
jgi:hypothetical protein